MEYGTIYATSGINSAMAVNAHFDREISSCVNKYLNQDWGDVCDEDRLANDYALYHGERIIGVYNTCIGKVYIITEADRSVTTILFAEEY